MEASEQSLDRSAHKKNLQLSDPMVIGASALFLGFVIGAGKWKWFGKEAGRIAESIGSMTLNSIYSALQEKNPQLFTEKSRVTH